MILLLFFLALVAYKAFAVPVTFSQPQSTLSRSMSNITSAYYNISYRIIPPSPSLSLASVSAPNFANATSLQLSHTIPANSFLSLDSSSVSPSSALSSSLPVSTIFVTEIATAFETQTGASAPYSTSIVTVVVTATATATAAVTAPSPHSWGNRTVWAAPPQMTDLSAFNVTYFPSGERNLHIVAQIPIQDTVPSASFNQTPTPLSLNDTAASTVLQLVYPAHSVNPGSKPEGGADFYATPLNLTRAGNVTLEYSVFFPVDFDWVKGGKLPGLFGGHTGCSGGASARDCFSTRLMWRPKGVGELYLYAPKDKQTTSLCDDPRSVCDASYGFSIGRGAFNFTAGGWTHLRQNVVLNTPGQNDGVFELFVDGSQAINRSDIFYRDVPRQDKSENDIPSVTEFVGLFFSTFFGGHGKQYATPKQQYTWFKNFAITRHD